MILKCEVFTECALTRLPLGRSLGAAGGRHEGCDSPPGQQIYSSRQPLGVQALSSLIKKQGDILYALGEIEEQNPG